ncbi:DUF748 domain-containing protein [uncultured Shewanella sp.]|uniref:DUF748 domain-containing protein n=1 Tax=uncultured Shewanella sp. TaxID=173975 RepID=UPI00262F170C|nr:DUF748 domain-containing protein [uncultured Shewanella sp.]
MPARTPTHKNRLQRLLTKRPFYSLILIVSLLYLFLSISIGFILPHLIKQYAPKHIETWLNRPITLSDININPIHWHVTISGFALQEKNGDNFITFKQLDFTFQFWQSLFNQAITCSNVRLTKPVIHITRLPDSPDITFNFSDILQRLAAKDPIVKGAPNTQNEQQNSLPGFIANRIQINNAQMYFINTINNRQLQYRDINLSLNTLNTKVKIKDGNLERYNTYEVSLVGEEGGEISTQGQLQVLPFDLKGQITLNKLSLPVLWEIAADEFPAQLQQGHLNAVADYHFMTSHHQQDNTLSPFINILVNDAKVSINNLSLSHQDARFLSLPLMKVEGIDFNLGSRKVNIKNISTQGLNIDANVDKQGIDIITFITPSRSITPPEDHEPPYSTAPWLFTVNKTQIEQAKINLTESVLSTPQLWQFSNLNVITGQIDSNFNQPMDYSTRFSINQQGEFNAKGTIDLQHLSSISDIKLSQLQLAQFKPYVDPYLNVMTITGTMNSEGKLTVDKTQQAQFNGKVTIEGFTLNHSEEAPLISWQSISALGVEMMQKNNNVSVDSIDIQQAKINLIKRNNGQFNVGSVVKAPSPNTQTASVSAIKKTLQNKHTESTIAASDQQTKPLNLKINQISIHESTHDFEDRSISPTFNSSLTNINGTLKNINLVQKTMVPFDFSANIGPHTPMTIKGKMAPFSTQPNTEFELNIQQFHLPPLSPYSSHFTGYDMDQGLMSVQSKYYIQNQQLLGENRILIEQVSLHDNTSVEPQTSLPLPLAIALLEDNQGIITLDLPVAGNLNAPEFNIGTILSTAFIQLITKAISSPFTLLSSLLATDDVLNTLHFDAASHQLTTEQTQTLSQLAKGLRQRPKLTVTIAHTDTQLDDKKAIATQQLHEKIAKQVNIDLQGVNLRLIDPYVSQPELANALVQLFEKETNQKAIILSPNAQERNETIQQSKQQWYQSLYDHLLEIQPVSLASLTSLTEFRLQNIKNYLVNQGQIKANRIHLSNEPKEAYTTPITVNVLVK